MNPIKTDKLFMGNGVCRGQIICRMPRNSKNNKLQFAEFHSPVDVLVAHSLYEVIPVLKQIEQYLSDGYYAAGYLAYEAGKAFDPILKTKKLESEPYIWFGIYSSVKEFSFDSKNTNIPIDLNLEPDIDKALYLDAVRKIKNYIFNGDIYQANLTFKAVFNGEIGQLSDFFELFKFLMKEHPVPYGAYIQTENSQIISLSPELFFEKINNTIISSPMKGTAARAPSYREDLKVAETLKNDPKNCAENLMIVDMVRNDLGKICKIGTVKVDSLFKVHTFRSVHQMVSDVSGKLLDNISLIDILKALYPAASITGAPKVRAMEIIDELEAYPRKIYTGSIACLSPDGSMCFNVAIRTLLAQKQSIELGIGSGIVADSNPEDEWNECILKSTFSKSEKHDFSLLETILWEKNKGFIFLDEHLNRMLDSCNYLQWNCSKSILKTALLKFNPSLQKNYRVRLLFSPKTGPKTEFIEISNTSWNVDKASVSISNIQTSSNDFFLYHKTTNRSVYDNAFKEALNFGFDEVLFMNEKGEITECAISNIFILLNGQWYTPELASGLLPGIWRSKMIDKLNASEKVIFLEDLKQASEIIIGNSVRGTVQASIV